MKKQTGIRLFFAILKLFALAALVFLLYAYGKKAYSFGYQVVAQEALSRPPGKDVAVTLDNGMTGEGLAELLEEKGLVRDAKVFYVQLLFSKEKHQLKKGSYLLNTSQTPDEMLKVLSGQEETESE